MTNSHNKADVISFLVYNSDAFSHCFLVWNKIATRNGQNGNQHKRIKTCSHEIMHNHMQSNSCIKSLRVLNFTYYACSKRYAFVVDSWCRFSLFSTLRFRKAAKTVCKTMFSRRWTQWLSYLLTSGGGFRWLWEGNKCQLQTCSLGSFKGNLVLPKIVRKLT